MKKIVSLLFTMILFISLNDVVAQTFNTTSENAFNEPRIVAASSFAVVTNYAVWNSNASQESKIMFTSGMASYILMNEYMNKREQSTGNTVFIFISTFILNTSAYTAYNWLILGNKEVSPSFSSISPNLGGIFSGMIVTYTLRF